MVDAAAAATAAANAAIAAAANRVQVRLPAFDPEDVDAFFTAAEASFDAAGVTVEKTKYSHIVSNLPTSVARRVRSVTKDPGAHALHEAQDHPREEVHALGR